MALQDRLRSGAKILDIAGHLDGLDHAARLAQVQALSGADQAALYERAGDAPALSLDFFVPAGLAPLTPVIHHGKNSQPAFRNFQKRFCRPESDAAQLYGYNETAVRPLIGPGYFVARPTDGGGQDPRGAVVVDYFLVPQSAVAAGWPPVRENSQGLQRFVYNKTRDYMRRVSEHVSIGKAVRLEKKSLGYFVLCRDAD